MTYLFPFGETVKRLVQEDRTPKKVFVLGVYASAVHARWSIGLKQELDCFRGPSAMIALFCIKYC